MKKMFVLSLLMSFAMVCSCQKQNSTAEQQLSQRKAELDAREKALAEREKALDDREKALAEREKAMTSSRTIPHDVQSRPAVRDPAQLKAERDRRIQQLPPELQAFVAGSNPSQLKAEKAEKTGKMQERSAQRQLGPEDLQRQWQRKTMEMSGGAVFPAPEASSPTPSPAVEATSPSPSPTPQ
jgi:hypothetical protein